MALLERDGQMEALRAALHAAASGRGSMVLVGGEAGIGKTTLVRHLRSRSGRARVLVGACDPLDTPRPLGPLHDMIPGLAPDLAGRIRTGGRREEILGSFREELDRRPSPTLVVIEDVHWADEATLDLLRFVGRRVDDASALVLVTYRDDALPARHPLRRVLGDLAGARGVRRMRLDRLSPDAVRDLASTSGRDIDPARLHERTGGNPFFVHASLASDGPDLPGTVRDAVLARVGRLDADARRVLDAAAVAGPVVQLDRLLRIADRDARAVEVCLDHGMLVEGPAGDVLTFRHELVRDALLGAMAATQRRELHRRALAVLEDRSDADPAVLAHHADGAGDEAAVLRYAPEAGARAARAHAHHEAARQYARALRFANTLAPPRRAELLEAHAAALDPIGRHDEAIRALVDACAIRRSGNDPGALAFTLARLGMTLVTHGRNADGERAVSEALQRLEGHENERVHAHVRTAWAGLRMLDRDVNDAIAGARRAIELAERSEDVTTLSRAQNVLGSALLVSGEHEAGRRHLEASLDTARAAGDDPRVAQAYVNLGSGFGEVMRLGDAERFLESGIAYCVERDFDASQAYMEAWQALVRLYQGRWTEAAEAARDLARRPGVAAITRMTAWLALGRVRARRGDPEAWNALDEALALAEATGTLQRIAPVRAARAEAAWLAGDAERTADEAGAALDLALRKRHAWFGGELAYWRWKAGASEPTPEFVARPYALQIRGSWRAAAKAWDEARFPYEAARARAEGADATERRRALETFLRLGARPAAQTLERALREAGVRSLPRGPRPSTRRAPGGLTDREREVARLLAEGLSNAEIADRLQRSPKTIGHHVSAILAKLEVRNRTEAARRAVELGVADAPDPEDGGGTPNPARTRERPDAS